MDEQIFADEAESIGRQLGETMMTVALLLGQEATLELIMQAPDEFVQASEAVKLEGWQMILAAVNDGVEDVDQLASLVDGK